MVKRKSLLLSLCIVLVAFITTTITFSLGNPNIEITYKGEVYESNEEFNMQWYSNDDEIKFTVDLSKQYEEYVNGGGTLASSEVPFKVKAKTYYGKKEYTFKDDLISISEISDAKYEVTINNQLIENDDIYIDVIMEKNNIWNTEKFTKSFNIKADKIAPTINIIDFPESNYVVISDKLNLSFKITEDNLNREDINIVAKKNGEIVNIDWKLEQNGNVLTYKAESYESGVYEFEISAKDKAGNIAIVSKDNVEIGEVFKSTFQFQKSGKLEFFDVPVGGTSSEAVDFKGYIYSIRDIELYYKLNDGNIERIETSYDEVFKKVSFAKTFSEEGTYKVWAEWQTSEESEKIIYDIATYIIDQHAPTITIKNSINGKDEPLESKKYDEAIKVSVSVNDDNLVYDNDGKLNGEKNKIIITYADGTTEVKSFDNTTTVLETMDEVICDIKVESTDAAGNSSQEERSIIVDSKAPEINVSFKDENEFNHYNQEIEFTATITDATLSFDDADAYNELELVKVESNGNESIAKIVNLNESYDNEGIKISSWSIQENSEKKGVITAVVTGIMKKEVEGNYLLRVKSKDCSKHESSLEKDFVIDIRKPVVTYNDKEKLSEKYKSAQEINIAIKDDNLYYGKIVCTLSNENVTDEIICDEEIYLSNEDIKEKIINHKIDAKEDGQYQLTVIAKDKAGNEYTMTQNFVVDSGKPVITIEGVENTSKDVINNYNESKNIIVTVRDITLDKGNTSLIVKKDGKEVKNIIGSSWGKGVFKVSHEFTINAEDEGLYTIEVTSKDKVNDEISSKNVTFIIDSTKPVINMDGVNDNEIITSKSLVDNLKISVEEKNYTDAEYTPEFKVTRNDDEVSYLEYKKESLIVITKEQLSKVFEKDGHYRIEATAEDKAGNKADKNKLSLEFIVDSTAPEISFSGIEAGSKNGINDNRQLTITVKEENYVTNNVVITATKDGNDYNIGEFQSYGEISELSNTFSENGHYEVIVTATDGAGNTTENKIDFSIDVNAPEISISGFSNGVYHELSGFTHYNTTQNITAKVKDNNLKVDTDGNYVLPKLEIFDINDGGANVTEKIVGDNSWNISDDEMVLDFDFTEALEDGKYKIDFAYTDNYGNVTTYDSLNIIIDGTSPEVTLVGIENDSYNNSSKTLYMKVVERNYYANTIDVVATKNGESFHIGSIDSNAVESTLSYNFTEDGLYTVAISAKDFAGNVAKAKNITFTIDKTNPEIVITGVNDGESYNVSKEVNVSILDVNHNINNVNVIKNGVAFNIGTLSLSGNTASISYNFSQEGEYVLAVDSTDKAGNVSSRTVKFIIDKTAPVITPMISGKDIVIKDGSYINEIFTPYFKLDKADDTIVSVMMNGKDVTGSIPSASKEGKYTFDVEAKDKAGNRSEISLSFTVDVTNPEVIITGIIDGFFNKNVKPVYKITDTNLDTGKSSVTLNDKPFESGTSIKEEGEYVLKAVGTDLATNTTKRTIIFTVDKTSPKIEFVEAIDGKYFTEAIIPELLITDLSEYTIISQTLNGKAYELGDEISEDGKYVLALEVVDKAGNTSTVSVEFIIDQTPPKFIYSGAKNGGKYYETVNLTVSLENPFDTIKEVLVNGDVAIADFVEENGQTVVKMKFSEIGEYKLDLYATDEAGNETRDVFTIEVAEKTLLAKVTGSNNMLTIGISVGIILLIILIILAIKIISKKKQILSDIEEKEDK